jgi:SOS-response transcriptional repressor LexA
MHTDLPNRQIFVKPVFAHLALESSNPLLHLANMAVERDSNQIRVARKRADLTLEEVAERTGLSPGYISRMESSTRNISTKNLRKIAEALGTTADKLIASDTGEQATQMPVRGEVRAGAWLEIDAETEILESIPALPDPRFSRAPQYALKVVGTSMNKVAPPGQYVIVVSWAELGAELRDGDLVVVKRSRAMTYEVTLKRARRGKSGEWELWPESTDPKHQEPVILGDGDREVEVEVVGKVVGRYEPL